MSQSTHSINPAATAVKFMALVASDLIVGSSVDKSNALLHGEPSPVAYGNALEARLTPKPHRY